MSNEYDEIRQACDEKIAAAMRRVAELKAQLAAAQAQRDEKDKQLASCYDRMNKAEAQRDKALAFLQVYRHETPLGNQPHMIAHEVDEFLKESGK